MALQRLSTTKQLKGLRTPTSLPGFKFCRKEAAKELVTTATVPLTSTSYTTFPLSTGFLQEKSYWLWKASSRLFSSYWVRFRNPTHQGRLTAKQQGRKWSESEYKQACLEKVSQIF